jgi:predicted nuclease of predicted toxin-antitoxin system
MHISPRTVEFLRALDHDVVRVNEVMPVTSTDEAIVLRALDDERVVLTQDLRFSAILGRAGQLAPSLIRCGCRHHGSSSLTLSSNVSFRSSSAMWRQAPS